MLPPNQLDVLPDAARLRARGIVYAYRNAAGVLITFHREPAVVQRDMVSSARRALATCVDTPAPERVPA
jgi:hypothetical protein